MIIQPSNVELTKIHYYDKNKKDHNLAISTVSPEVCENNFNTNVIIKKNVFGHKWVLKINENKGEVSKKKTKLRVVIYVLVFCSIIVAVCFGIFLSLDRNIFNNVDTNKYIDTRQDIIPTSTVTEITHENQLELTYRKDSLQNSSYGYRHNKSITSKTSSFCRQCLPRQEICMKTIENETPKCVKVVNRNDPTGCGGLCKLNTHFCHNLNYQAKVYQCSLLKNILKCPNGTFSCGNMCISIRRRCDGVLDCSNRSDEENCECDMKTHFQCGNSTSCLEKKKKCDRKVDCWDKSDELNCIKVVRCHEEEIPCSDGHCISKKKFCDKHFDCPDKTDEPEGCRS